MSEHYLLDKVRKMLKEHYKLDLPQQDQDLIETYQQVIRQLQQQIKTKQNHRNIHR